MIWHPGVSPILDPPWLLLPQTASEAAEDVDLLFLALLGFSALIVLVVFGLVLVFGIRYRAGSSASRRDPVTRTTPIELTWLGAATVAFLALFLWAARVYFDMEQPPEDAMSIYVVGKQWMWKAEHPSGRREINALHVPVGEPVRLVMTSQDVIHSFYVPAFRVKQDVLPGRFTALWFEATRIGRYPFQCAEYCGADHSLMGGTVTVMSPADYQRWASAASDAEPVPGTPGIGAPLAVRGRGAFFRFGCNSCHLPGASVRAPRLDGIWSNEVRLNNGESVIADEHYIRESILEPNAKISAGYPEPSLMPTYRGQVTEEDLRELIELVRSIEHGWPEEVAPP